MARGKSAFHSVLKFLETPPVADGATRLRETVQSLLQRSRRRGLIYLLSDFFDPRGYEEPLAMLLHAQYEVQVLQILDPEEISPSETGDLSLREPEGGNSLDLIANESLLRRYRDEINQFTLGLEKFCLRRGIPSATVTTDKPFGDVVLRALRDGVMMR